MHCNFVFAQSIPPPPHLDPVNRVLWSDKQLGIRFTYPKVWEEALATQSQTNVVINWRTKASKTLLAACYIESARNSELANQTVEIIKSNADEIAQIGLRNMKKRAPDAQIVNWKSVLQDGYPMVYAIKTGSVARFDSTVSLKTYSLVTVWQGYEINFECGTEILDSKYRQTKDGVLLIEQVEKGILHVLRTLQFDRF